MRVPSAEFLVPPSGPRTLAAIRIVIAAQALWILLSRDPAGVSAMPAAIWRLVDDSTRLRYLLVPGIPGVESVLWVGAAASLACVLFGFHTRIFGLVAAVLLYHIAPLQALPSVAGPWGKGLTIATLSLPVLACSPCDDRWSITGDRPPGRRDDAAYGWAVAVVRLLFAQIYLFTALGRIMAGGFEWTAVESVRTHLLVFGLAYPHLNTPLNAWIVAHPAICAIIAAGTLLFELLFVAAVFVRRARVPLAIAGALFHASLWLTLGFRYPNMAHFLLFIDFERPRALAATHRSGAAVGHRPEVPGPGETAPSHGHR